MIPLLLFLAHSERERGLGTKRKFKKFNPPSWDSFRNN